MEFAIPVVYLASDTFQSKKGEMYKTARYLLNNVPYQSFVDDKLYVSLSKLKPGQEVTLQFTVREDRSGQYGSRPVLAPVSL